MIHSILFATATASLTVSVFILLYHAILVVVAMVPRAKIPAGEFEACGHRFAIIVPAHNEENTIQIALGSCRELEYSEENYELFVVADNCTDRTAAVAEGYGCNVLVRNDTEKRGKGHALRYAFEKVLESDCDAMIVLDADCRIHPNTLKIADYHLRRGDRVLQCNNRVSNVDDSPTTLLLAAANALENDFFYAPKSRLGLFVLLRGTGMVFHREIFERFPWDASSVIEDAQYSYRLAIEGVNTRFVPEVGVVSDFPVNRPQLTVQRERWLGGGIRFALGLSPKMLAAGLKKRRLALVDAALSTWLIMRPFIVAQLCLTFALVLVLQIVDGSFAASLMLAATVAVFAGYAAYALLGLVRLDGGLKHVLLLACLPVALMNYLWLSVRTLLRGSPTEWQRTPRAMDSEN